MDILFNLVHILAVVAGYMVLAGFTIMLVMISIVYENTRTYLMFKVFGFGFVYARGEELAQNLNTLRKTKGRRLFLDAPLWFNKYVYNLGVVVNKK